MFCLGRGLRVVWAEGFERSLRLALGPSAQVARRRLPPEAITATRLSLKAGRNGVCSPDPSPQGQLHYNSGANVYVIADLNGYGD